MSSVRTVPLLLSTLMALMLGWVIWALWRARNHQTGGTLMGMRDDVLLVLLLLAVFGLGIFLAYILLAFEGR